METKVSNEEVVNDIIQQFQTSMSQDKLPDEAQIDEKLNVISINDNKTNEDAAQLDSSNEDSSIADVDDETLQNLEISMSQEDKEKLKEEALNLKLEGNKMFGTEKYMDAINSYTKALNMCPFSYKDERSIFYCNRAAAKIKLDYTETAIEDCTKALELNPDYIKAYIRRAKLYEKVDKLDESLADFKKVVELEPSNNEAKASLIRLPPMINERNEKLKEEMLGKLLLYIINLLINLICIIT